MSWITVVALVLALTSDLSTPVARAADFDRDGYADLAIGVPGEGTGTLTSAGALNVLYGTPDGISASGDQLWEQGELVLEDGTEENDRFGWALSAGDFDGDGAADLAVGVPYEDIGNAEDGGAVHVLYGAPPLGLQPERNQL